MKAVVATHPAALEHDTGDWHPERPARVHAVLEGLRSSGLEIVDLKAPRITRDELLLVHDPAYIDDIEAMCRHGGGMLDFDTVVSPRSWDAALRSAGAVRALVEELESSTDATGFAVTRPPGHHATSHRAMGFCLFNNVAVAAAILRDRGQRVAILDWDVHHGNGTQRLLGDDPGVLFVSIHQSDFYPFEGHPGDIERMAPGTNINIPVPSGTAGDVIRELWDDLVIPVVGRFAPDWVLVSCGFDAHVRDPIGELNLVAEDYGWMASRIGAVVPPQRLVFALEGGYDLDALRDSSAAVLRGVAGSEFEAPLLVSPPQSMAVMAPAARAIARHWTS